MNRFLVYDLVTRIFHWLFVGLFLASFIIAEVVDDESLLYSYHMLAGILLAFTVLLRGIWGFVGSKYARFSHFALNLKDLVSYLKGIVSGSKKRWVGHNPASSWAGIIMMLLALALAVTGYLMTTGNKEAFEDAHEVLANAFLVVALLHVAGILVHSIRHKDFIVKSMIDGKKADISSSEAISSARPVWGILFFGLVVALGIHLLNNFDTQTRKLEVFGHSLILSEEDKD